MKAIEVPAFAAWRPGEPAEIVVRLLLEPAAAASAPAGAAEVNAPLLHKVEDAAQLLDISRAVLSELIGQGAIESVKIGASRRIPHDALTDYIARLRANPA